MVLENKIPEGWIRAALGDVCENISRRFNFHDKETVVFVNTGDVSNGKFLHHNKISKEGLPGQAKKAIEIGDILFSEIRPKNKRFALVDFDSQNYVVSTKFMVLKRNDKIDLDFFYLFLKSNKIINAFQSHAEARSGTFPQITFDTISLDEIILPPLPEQKAIAKVLTIFDDKIELLQAQNKTLETMAQTIFKDWFGKYQIGDELPEGWKVGRLRDLGDIICGKTPSKADKENFGGNIPFIKIPDMHNQMFIIKTSDSLTNKGVSTQKNKLIPKNSICVSCIATVGLVSITSKDSQTNQQINSILPFNDSLREFIYFKVKGLHKYLQDIGSGGTATLNVNTSSFSNIEIIIPNIKKLNAFNIIVNPMFEKVFDNYSQIESLTKTRDTLFPKLMSGQVRVNNIKQTANA